MRNPQKIRPSLAFELRLSFVPVSCSISCHVRVNTTLQASHNQPNHLQKAFLAEHAAISLRPRSRHVPTSAHNHQPTLRRVSRRNRARHLRRDQLRNHVHIARSATTTAPSPQYRRRGQLRQRQEGRIVAVRLERVVVVVVGVGRRGERRRGGVEGGVCEGGQRYMGL